MKFFIVRIFLDVTDISAFQGRFRESRWLFYLGDLRRLCSLSESERERDGSRIQTRLQGLRRRGRRCFVRHHCLSTRESELFFIGFVGVTIQSRMFSEIIPDILRILDAEHFVISCSNVIIGGTEGATGRPSPAQDRQKKAIFGSRLQQPYP